MTEKLDKAYLKEKLESQREKVLESLKLNEDEAKKGELDQSRPEYVPDIDTIEHQAMSLATSYRLQLELRRIDATLERLETKFYGHCMKCGEDIEWEQLKANPSLIICDYCMKKQE